MCEYADRCWRLAYSRCLVSGGYDERGLPPSRWSLVCAGFASDSMMGKSRGDRIYAELMPLLTPSGPENLCPELVGRDAVGCRERAGEARRLELLSSRGRRRRIASEPRICIPKEVRVRVAQRCRYKCSYCLRPVGTILEDGSRLRGQIDHVVPRATGGSQVDEGNLTLACHRCNADKGTDVWSFGCRAGWYDDPSL